MSLEKAAFITAILGTLLLIFLSEHLEPNVITVGKITIKDLDNYVQIQGNITYIKHYSTSTLLKIEDSTGKIYGIFYGAENITKGSALLTGKITEYKGILELEISKIQSNKEN